MHSLTSLGGLGYDPWCFDFITVGELLLGSFSFWKNSTAQS